MREDRWYRRFRVRDLRAYRGEKAVERVGYFFAVGYESAISAEFRDFV
jgi:hypothetical protein